MTSLAHVATLRLGLRRHHAHAVWAPAGVPVTVAPSWLLGVALTAWTVADALLPEAVPGRSMGAYATIGVATAATLALTLALHEAAHCAVARRAGLGVRRLTLSFLGGALELAEPPATPAVEARVALAGPLASAGAALLASAAHLMLVAAGVDPLLPAAAAVIAIGNVLIAAFNCLPTLPLDGGRALHAAVWALTGREATGVRLATVIGRGLGLVLLGVAIVASASGDAALAIWLGLMGLTMRGGVIA
jgi:Zn-dependent protease